MNPTFVPVLTDEQLTILANLADEIWHEYFPCILTPEQIDYMVDKFQSRHAMADQMAHQNYRYYFISLDGTPVGYIGIQPGDGKLFLSKLYLKKEYRGQGLASRAFDFLEELCQKEGLRAIWLTVNKYNDHSLAVYRRRGFQTVRSQVTDIGRDFVMDDYVLEKTL